MVVVVVVYVVLFANRTWDYICVCRIRAIISIYHTHNMLSNFITILHPHHHISSFPSSHMTVEAADQSDPSSTKEEVAQYPRPRDAKYADTNYVTPETHLAYAFTW